MKDRLNLLVCINSVFAWIALAACVILIVPLIAMRFTSEVNWSMLDFVAMGLLLFLTGGFLVLAFRWLGGWNRVIGAVLVVAVFIYIWAELAVGVFFDYGS